MGASSAEKYRISKVGGSVIYQNINAGKRITEQIQEEDDKNSCENDGGDGGDVQGGNGRRTGGKKKNFL